MRRLLVCQHVPFEILGTLNRLFKSFGFRIKYVNFGRRPDADPGLDGYDGLIVLGGPMSANDSKHFPHLDTEIRLIEAALAREIPILGICLGAQLLARALGASVRAAGEKEIGWYDVSVTDAGREDPLFSRFADTERIFQWHGDTFDIPKGCSHLATSEACSNQAFRFGDRVYGLQFHLEVDRALIERWLTVPVHLAELESLGGQVAAEEIRAETRERIGQLTRLSDRTFEAFIGQFEAARRRRRHVDS